MRSIVRVLTPIATAAVLVAGIAGQQPRFFADDPLQREPESQDASKAQPWEIPLTPDLLANLFGQPGDPKLGLRAKNVNTADEVPDSSWFTNRIYARPMTLEEIAKGPNTIDGPAPGRWTIIRAKSAGVAPGFTIKDEKGETWFISFDGKSNPVAPTAAVMVATKLFHALGYNQVETYLTSVRPDQIAIDPAATLREHGKRRPITMADINDVFARAARSADGSYRAVAGRAVPGKPLGGFKYFGTRPDDPNDIVPHEHRRELRALQVFGAWTNLVDLKAGNTLDTLVIENGRGIVKHYLQDVGSTFGTGALYPRDGDEGHEHLVEIAPAARRLVSFGLWMQPWQRLDYKEHPEIGRFEAEHFDPLAWKPRVNAAALRHARADDTFWAALRVMAFTDEHIRAAVKTGGFTDPAAEELLTSLLAARRDKIGRVYFTRVNPLTRFRLSDAGELTFENPAVTAGFEAEPAKGYEAAWARFENGPNTTTPSATTTGTGSTLRAPANLLSSTGGYIKVSIKALDAKHPAWAQAVDVYFRREGQGWSVAGLERQPAGETANYEGGTTNER